MELSDCISNADSLAKVTGMETGVKHSQAFKVIRREELRYARHAGKPVIDWLLQ